MDVRFYSAPYFPWITVVYRLLLTDHRKISTGQKRISIIPTGKSPKLSYEEKESLWDSQAESKGKAESFRFSCGYNLRVTSLILLTEESTLTLIAYSGQDVYIRILHHLIFTLNSSGIYFTDEETKA